MSSFRWCNLYPVTDLRGCIPSILKLLCNMEKDSIQESFQVFIDVVVWKSPNCPFLQVSAAKIQNYFFSDKNLKKSSLTITLSLWYISKPVSSFPYHHNPSHRYWNQNILVIVAYVLFGNQFIGVGFYCCPNKCSLFVSQNSSILNIGYCILAPNTGVGAVHKTGKAQQIVLRKKKPKQSFLPMKT